MTKYAIKLADNSTALLFKNKKRTRLLSENYNFTFNKTDGYFVRWGKTLEDDGKLELGIPEIADIEISTICHGVNNIPCAFCYKGNTGRGTYMSLDTFKKVFRNLPPSITQIAFGIGDIEGNPDMWDIFDHCIINGVVPNVTVNGEGITDEIADKLVSKCGAVAVSLYDFNKTYDTVKKLTDKGLKQTNIHFMLSKETYDKAFRLMHEYVLSRIEGYTDENRIKDLNAIVFLSLKKQGRATNGYDSLTIDEFKEIIDYAFRNNVPIGFDSCSAQKFIKSIKGNKYEERLTQLAEPCESTLYSMYVNTEGRFFPCSFVEGTEGWEKGIDMTETDNFFGDVWYNNDTKSFREKVIDCRNCGKSCPIFKV
jgi:hypothetical protein